MTHEDKCDQEEDDDHCDGSKRRTTSSYASYTIPKKSRSEDSQAVDNLTVLLLSADESSCAPSSSPTSVHYPLSIGALRDINENYSNLNESNNATTNSLHSVAPATFLVPSGTITSTNMNGTILSPTFSHSPNSPPNHETTTTAQNTNNTNLHPPKPATTKTQNLNNTNNCTTTKPSTTKTQNVHSTNNCTTSTPSNVVPFPSSYTSVSEYSPEDSVNEIITDVKYQEKLYEKAIYTIRQLAEATGDDLPTIQSDLYLHLLQDTARRVVIKSINEPSPEPLPPIWVYHYVGEAVYQQIKYGAMFKSAFVLYSEYLDLPFETRVHHPWVRVYRAYARDAAEWVQPKKNYKLITDLDVYSFLVWRAATSFAKYDCTAGPKAIYFNWEPIPAKIRQQCAAVDAIIAADTRNDDLADRYARVIGINLTAVVEHCQGKIFRVEPANKNNWVETSLEGSICMKGRKDLWDNFVPGGPYFQDVPHGCIVTPLGQIPMEYLDLEGEPVRAEELPTTKTTPAKNSNTPSTYNFQANNKYDNYRDNKAPTPDRMDDETYPFREDHEYEYEYECESFYDVDINNNNTNNSNANNNNNSNDADNSNGNTANNSNGNIANNLNSNTNIANISNEAIFVNNNVSESIIDLTGDFCLV
eukprot:Phypoly_transcript_04159.p1 GENE.Phypoly_transcript_04159~~Phypoly_transcript_04159.p1  ORF type:complete len:680 (+),score=97.55 Phypoly_transcript_04159:113-2041(+)